MIHTRQWERSVNPGIDPVLYCLSSCSCKPDPYVFWIWTFLSKFCWFRGNSIYLPSQWQLTECFLKPEELYLNDLINHEKHLFGLLYADWSDWVSTHILFFLSELPFLFVIFRNSYVYMRIALTIIDTFLVYIVEIKVLERTSLTTACQLSDLYIYHSWTIVTRELFYNLNTYMG